MSTHTTDPDVVNEEDPQGDTQHGQDNDDEDEDAPDEATSTCFFTRLK
jgi:hypothetical protein